MTTATTTQTKPATFEEFSKMFHQLPPEDQADIVCQMAMTAWRNLIANADRALALSAAGRDTAPKE